MAIWGAKMGGKLGKMGLVGERNFAIKADAKMGKMEEMGGGFGKMGRAQK